MRAAFGLLAALGLAACGSDPLEPLRPDGSRPPTVDASAPRPPVTELRDPPTCEEEIGRPMVRRLTSTQLTNTLEDLFQSSEVPTTDALLDPTDHGYDVDASAVIRDHGADRMMYYAEEVSAWAVDSRLHVFVPCDDLSPLCRVTLVRELGQRLFRRPISNDELQAYDTLAMAEDGFPNAVRAVLSAMLQSPYFLYRREIGVPVDGDVTRVRLTPHELASALAFFITNSAPDAALLEAATQRRLETDEDIDRELDRLLGTERARQTLAHFATQWLLVDDLRGRPKDPAVGVFSDAVRASMLRETGALFVDVLESGGGFADLLQAPESFVDGPLAAFYGLDGISGSELVRFDLVSAHRAPGVLGLGSVLARHALADTASPVQRGGLVRERFLCQVLEPPPPSVDTTLHPPRGAATTRERYQQHSADPFCAGCHRLTDPIGFSLGHYDAFGRRRDEEGGQPIDATGEIVETPDGDVPLDGAESLSRYLATSPEARACFVQNLAYFAVGVTGCTYASVLEDLEPDTPLREILRRIVHTNHFRYRRVAAE